MITPDSPKDLLRWDGGTHAQAKHPAPQPCSFIPPSPYLPHTVWVVEQASVCSLAPEAPSKRTEGRWSGSQGTKQAPAGEWAQRTP